MSIIGSDGKGNSKSQTTASTSTTQNTVNTVDNRAVQGDGAVFGGNVTVNPGESSQISTLNIETTDQGAVRAGLDIALSSIGSLKDIVGSTLAANSSAAKTNASVASDSIAQAYGLANEARQSETSGAINNVLKYGAVILVIGIIAYAVVKTKR